MKALVIIQATDDNKRAILPYSGIVIDEVNASSHFLIKTPDLTVTLATITYTHLGFANNRDKAFNALLSRLETSADRYIDIG